MILVKDGHLAKIPENLTFEEGASLGTNLVTIGHALYFLLQIPLPEEPVKRKYQILVHGAGTSTGTLAIQMAKL
jgi:NADPH:quinone reductase-like Zn-dependent oxidoreductase